MDYLWSGKRDSNSRPQPWQGCALPTELFPRNTVPKTGIEPARLSTLAPETSASTIPPLGHKKKSGKRDSNSRPQPWQGCALPTELFPHLCMSGKRDSNSRPQPWQGCALPTELFPQFLYANAKVMLFPKLTNFFWFFLKIK